MLLRNLIILFNILVGFIIPINAKIRVVCSSALLSKGYEMRKKEYITGINILRQYGYENPYFIEAIAKKGPTFLDNHTINVFYSTKNIAALRNKGVNEGRTMLEGLKYFNFDPEDIIVKLSGRYHLTSAAFLRLIEQNPGYAGFVRSDGSKDGIYTFCYALKEKYMREILESLDYEKMEKEMICVEHEIGRYIKKFIKERNIKIMYINKLNIKGFAWGWDGPGNGVPQAIYW